MSKVYLTLLIIAAVLLMLLMSGFYMWLPADLMPIMWIIVYSVSFLLVALLRRWLVLLATGVALLLLFGLALTMTFNADDEGFGMLLLLPSPIGVFTGMLAASTVIGARALRLRWVKPVLSLPLFFAAGIGLWLWVFFGLFV